MKILKYLFLTLFSLVLLVVLVVAGLLIFVSPNQFKGQIVQAVEEATGRHFEIQGPISWSFYPGFGLEVRGVVLSNPAGYSDSPLVAIEDAQVSLALWPLLSKEVQVQDIVVSGVQIHLIQISKLHHRLILLQFCRQQIVILILQFIFKIQVTI